jgi:hypothetical protein
MATAIKFPHNRAFNIKCWYGIIPCGELAWSALFGGPGQTGGVLPKIPPRVADVALGNCCHQATASAIPQPIEFEAASFPQSIGICMVKLTYTAKMANHAELASEKCRLPGTLSRQRNLADVPIRFPSSTP